MHVLPQALQLAGSLDRSLQPSLQQVLLPAQAGPPLQLHLPPTQLLPLVHGGLHCDVTQWPSMQASPFGHSVAQSPQCLGSVDGSKQPSPPGEPAGQQIWLPVQALPPLQVQPPFWHASPVLQAWLQLPQLALPSLTQLPPQQSCVAVQLLLPHRHWPPLHTSPLPQRLPQPPQLLGSFDVLAQPEAQQVSLAAQMAPLQVQAPPAQASGAAQA
jgi:hypothetical protein